ncbi:xanthine dehydrogenase family protein molybdopterin-binding subunit [Spirosoma utsteinense]|uniref:Isoquinoline 1-oxidoreductase beta subunit n=1 Tax=Spirosoma utsteinense TaxID=2585773 RepID=A0ABR6W127_9BACT|nr:molybdopterin cofactor-binding domain-containing protein [Spirosoma utsteinense]MBC3783715.1 isoquinoline 1-oxidoreductase beta subunit [Spirosoma utsteinense]MBC3790142.1 isoquinoline 1-oxidoreductase beta subunit [Spirosoma utsteinense]
MNTNANKTGTSRRGFLKATSLTGVAFALGFSSTDAFASPVLNLSTKPGLALPEAAELTPYVIIEKSGRIIIMNPRPEIGQGTYQSVPALIAEELEVSLDKVTIRQTGGEPKYGELWSQAVGGSGSIRGGYTQMRKVGASAREMLIQAASQQWNVPLSECFAEKGSIVHKPTGKRLPYGQLAETAAKLPVPKEPVLKDPKQFTMLGKSMPRPDVPLKVTGQAMFGIDASVPAGMLYASIERCPVFGSTLVGFDAAQALNVKGVRKAVKVERVVGKNRYEGVAIVADNYWAAMQGRKALKVTWKHNGHDTFNSADFENKLRELAKTDGVQGHNVGDFDKSFADSASQVEAFYETPIVSHSTMEPMNALAHYKPGVDAAGDKVELWVSSQGGDLVRDEVAKVLNVPADNITVHVLFNGGGFGRRLTQDFATEAALLSKAIGKPVKVVWTREDDTQLGPFRPMTFSAMRGALSADGKAVALQHKVIAPSIDATMNATYDKTKPDATMLEATNEQKYEIPNLNTRYVHADVHVPLTYWRSVTSSTLAFAHECFIDEMAHKAGQDPLAFRLAMLTKDSDAKRVLMKLKEVSGWDQPLPEGKGRGIAQWEFFAGLAGQVVEVSKDKDGGVKVDKVYCVIDLGTVVNPDTVQAQVEGSVAMALTAATKAGITFEGGQAVQKNFDTNQMVRINEMPPVEVHILAEGGPVIKGVGEPGLPPLAPALANAVFAATGKRIRKLPFDLGSV